MWTPPSLSSRWSTSSFALPPEQRHTPGVRGRSLLVLVLLTACSGTSPGATSTPKTTPSRTPVTAANAACAPAAVRTFVTSFLSAYNAGAPDIVQRFIAPKPDFQWFGQPDRPFPSETGDAQNLDTLSAYLAKRHRLGDHFALSTLRIGDQIDSFGNRGFAIQLVLSRPRHVPCPHRRRQRDLRDRHGLYYPP